MNNIRNWSIRNLFNDAISNEEHRMRNERIVKNVIKENFRKLLVLRVIKNKWYQFQRE
jgi:hypothetical protein